MTRDDITGLRKAAEMALEAFDSDNSDIQLRAATALRAALDKHKKRMARDKKRMKPPVPRWMMRP
jgi:hypothetical protein